MASSKTLLNHNQEVRKVVVKFTIQVNKESVKMIRFCLVQLKRREGVEM